MDFENAEIVSIERKIIANDCSLRLGIPKWTKVLAMTILTFQTFIPYKNCTLKFIYEIGISYMK
jgi:hypothetical protein